MSVAETLPYATRGLPGCGGRIKDRPEDFRVEEIPLYAPSGQGEHLYLRVEKLGATTHQLLTALTRAYSLPSHAAGHAGLKDAHAVTSQWISLHTPQDADPARWPEGPWRLLDWSRHANKLRPGHLRGNRFEIVVRGIHDVLGIPGLIRSLSGAGFPNFFGPQRFGRDGSNAQRGKALLTASYAVKAQSPQARLMVNAYQAELFNRILANRLDAVNSLAQMLDGDLAVLHRNGASFPVKTDSLAETQSRADTGELSASAPLIGYRVTLAQGQPGEWEAVQLERENLQLSDFRRFSKRDSPRGERRPIRVMPEALTADTATEAGEAVLRIRVTLPAGAYATSLMREIIKEPQALNLD